jgi:hypothetical protein
MTPKEKAAELINKMYYTQSSPTHWVQAKECALIAVDEIYALRLIYGQYLHYDLDKINYAFYWEDVKKEIEKL